MLDAARHIALRSGFVSVTISSVARELDVARTVIYSCYPDRDTLVAAVLEREREAVVASVITALHSTAGHATLEEAFVAGFRAYIATETDDPDTWSLMMLADSDAQVRQCYRDARHEVKEQVESWLGPVIATAWEIEDVESKLPYLIEYFMVACEGAIQLARGIDDPAHVDRIAEIFGRGTYHALSSA